MTDDYGLIHFTRHEDGSVTFTHTGGSIIRITPELLASADENLMRVEGEVIYIGQFVLDVIDTDDRYITTRLRD